MTFLRVFARALFCFILYFSLLFPGRSAPAPDSSTFFYKIEPIPKDVRNRMASSTWEPGRPVSLDDLSYLTLMHWGFDYRVHRGHLVLHKNSAEQIADAFREIFLRKFPIQRVGLASDLGGDDKKLMSQNVTSALNCRPVTGRTGTFSKHSYGIAIDINPVENPYVKGTVVLPESRKGRISRDSSRPGTIVKDDLLYRAFLRKGWTWGGDDWRALKDYQHFEKTRPNKP